MSKPRSPLDVVSITIGTYELLAARHPDRESARAAARATVINVFHASTKCRRAEALRG